MLSRLTDAEYLVLDKLVEAHNAFVKLPVQHPMHQQEWVTALHQLQRLVMVRPVERQEGWIKDDDGNIQSTKGV